MRKALGSGVCRMLHRPSDMDGINKSTIVTRQERIDDFTHEGIRRQARALNSFARIMLARMSFHSYVSGITASGKAWLPVDVSKRQWLGGACLDENQA
jgi:hypothetical protein